MSQVSHLGMIAGIVCLLVLAGLILMYALRSRVHKEKETQQDDLLERIEERLATGRFSRGPSTIRRKAGLTEHEPKVPTKVEKEDGEDDFDITRPS